MSFTIKFIYPPFVADHFVAVENRKSQGARFTDSLNPRSVAERVAFETNQPPSLEATMARDVLSEVKKFINECLPFDAALWSYFAVESLERDIIKRIKARRVELKIEEEVHRIIQETVHDLKMHFMYLHIARSRAIMREFIRIRTLTTQGREQEFMKLWREAMHDYQQRVAELNAYRKKEAEKFHELFVEPRLQRMDKVEKEIKSQHERTERNPLHGDHVKPSLARLLTAKQQQNERNPARAAQNKPGKGRHSNIVLFDEIKHATTRQADHASHPAAGHHPIGPAEPLDPGRQDKVVATENPQVPSQASVREQQDVDGAERLARDIIEGRRKLDFQVNLQETNQKLAAMELMTRIMAQEMAALSRASKIKA